MSKLDVAVSELAKIIANSSPHVTPKGAEKRPAPPGPPPLQEGTKKMKNEIPQIKIQQQNQPPPPPAQQNLLGVAEVTALKKKKLELEVEKLQLENYKTRLEIYEIEARLRLPPSTRPPYALERPK